MGTKQAQVQINITDNVILLTKMFHEAAEKNALNKM